MNRKTIKLADEKALKIYMDPIRQRVLRTMEIAGIPLTAKKIADEINMTPASAKHHLTKLQSIGLVELDHIEIIHGINAKFYRATDVDVKLGMDEAEYRTEKAIIAENQVMSIFKDFTDCTEQSGQGVKNNIHGDCLTGVVHLTEMQFHKIQQTIMKIYTENQTKSSETTAYEVALIYCGVRPKE